MSDNNGSAPRQPTPPTPQVGALLIDAQNQVGEFRGAWCGRWFLRPVTGGKEWAVLPEEVRPVSPAERLHAEVARANARSQGKVL
ncbi:hypothetical protein JJV70_14995 [Streptomyces sp. JJ66]|uniref:hypothetical protein n=1 Tax=Streptomyces sp. JJ66 TaxID=2803843 RepID=UPI001C57BFCF|nr:hypothetical protein [Streptomyces sp. JJ66]MBW1603385.1 hypothetical protein [Streptomyces sp. JJ66]